MTPTDPYVLQGEKLELNCTIQRDQYEGPKTASDIVFTAGVTPIPSKYVHILNETTAQLVLPNISEIATVTKPFNCFFPPENGTNKVLLGKQFVHIASK